ncbi:sugar-binding transcriptional regulator [Ruicaihuangia caeni]|uniref:Sugar-binding domain-containing protein n=1 Tax=Ruicaihuangia caeni TaxID=3042517 RepID=A0AAW6TCA7_9MICO|nr:sugar-binding domain-containing protein [Klugiella sp. YN-L-19]MDI2099468.1 sugar-binding domain-containing protein [Klugiella sp. YN-L-19]
MESTHELHRAAHLYYVQELTMDAIARDLNTSRSTVSRMLARARQLGIVKIEVELPSDQNPHVLNTIARRFGVTAHLVPVPRQLSDVDVLDRVAAGTARLLGQHFESGMSLGIAWGSTLTAVSRHLSPKDLTRTKVVQLNGAASSAASGVEVAGEILRRFARAFGSESEHFPVPAFFDNPATKAAMWKERSVRRVLELQRQLDIALFGIGSPRSQVPGKVYRADYLDRDDYAGLAQAGVVGDIATVFFRADGTSDGIPLNARSTGPDFETLRKVPRRICVVAGRGRLLALRGALEAGLVSDIVIDEPTATWFARELLN